MTTTATRTTTSKLEDFLDAHGLRLWYTSPHAQSYHAGIESAVDQYRFADEAFVAPSLPGPGWVSATGFSTMGFTAARENLIRALQGNRLILNPDAGLARKYETRVIPCPATLA